MEAYWKLIAALLVALAIHPLILRLAIRLMVEVPVRYAHACRIVGIEYLAAGVALLLLIYTRTLSATASYAIAAAVLIVTGAVLIGRGLSFADGVRLGVGNGVLIQFMQIPLTLPLLIIGSFFLTA